MKTKKYKFGSFVTKNASGIGQVAGLGAGLLSGLQSDNVVDTGADIGSGALNGLAAGASFGPIGMAGGAIIGGVAGLISSGAKKRKLEKIRQNTIDYQNGLVDANMTTTNSNMYGNTYADGGTIMPIDSTGRKPIKIDKNLNAIVSQNSTGQFYNNGILMPGLLPMSDKAVGVSNTYTPARYQQQGPSIPTQKRSNARFEQGGIINSEQNKINIEKGELLIDPDTGKILQEFDGINPLTGGKYQAHSKKGKDTKHNFTFADPGLFVINTINAKKYKNAIDNNDKLSQKTILMNIQNNKITESGGLEKMADGGQVTGDPGMGYLNIPQWNPPQSRTLLPYVPQLQAKGITINDLNLGATTGKLVNTTLPTPTKSSTTSNSNGFNWSGALDGIANYGIPVLNIARGLFGSPATQNYTTPIANPNRNKILANLPSNINLNPMINQVRLNERLATQDLRNNVNNSAVYRANRQQLATNANKQINDLQFQEQLTNNNIGLQRADILNNLGTQEMAEQSRVRDYNLNIDMLNNQAKAAQQNILNSGLSQLQQVYQNNKANKRKQQMDQYSLDILGQIYPLTKYYNVFSSNYLK